MSGRPTSFVLVVGTGWTGPGKRHIARLVGRTLADCGFGLVTGNSTGVDRWVAESFCGAVAARGGVPEQWMVQVTLGGWRFLRRGGAPLPGFSAPAGCRVPVADRPDVFVSYRRSDAPAAAGRLAHDLAEHFGTRRVFLDVADIAPSHAWDRTIGDALGAVRAGIVIIGRDWLRPGRDGRTPRLHEPDDVVRAEIRSLLQGGQAVFPLLVEGAALPEAEALPPDLVPLLRRQAIAIGNADWASTLALLVREIESVLQQPRAAGSGPPSVAGS